MAESQILFDKLRFIDRLKEGGSFTEPQARVLGDAVDEALRQGVATKADIALVRADMLQLKYDVTVRMGVIAVALFGALTATKFFG